MEKAIERAQRSDEQHDLEDEYDTRRTGLLRSINYHEIHSTRNCTEKDPKSSLDGEMFEKIRKG
jgi:hypothetical protein